MQKILEWVAWGMSILSVGILLSGVVLLIRKRGGFFLVLYLLLLFLMELSGLLTAYLNFHNLNILSFSAYLHFVVLVYGYLSGMFLLEQRRALAIIAVSSLPMLLTISLNRFSVLSFQSYDRVFYGFVLTVLSLVYFYRIIALGKTKIDNAMLLLNTAVLLFFSLDTLWAVGVNYFVNEQLALVAWFWFCRALLMQFYYVAIIHYLCSIEKTP